MKTFLWTTLFWVVVAIAWLLCLWFGNFGTQVLDNGWMAKVLPHNVQNKACEPMLATAMEWVDWCSEAEAHECNSIEKASTSNEESQEIDIQTSLNDIMEGQQKIYNYLQESFASMSNEISKVSLNSDSQWLIVDENQQEKLRIQAEIDALQAKLSDL